MWCICPSSLRSLFVEKRVFGSGCSYFTVPKLWFLMEHHAMNISLKNRKCKFRKVLWKRKVGTCTFQTCTHLQWVATHSLLQYSLSQSSHSMAGLLQPALAHTLLVAEASLDPFTSISSWKKKLAQIWVSLISVMGIFCILMKACHIRWSCNTSLSFRMRLYDTVKAKVRMKMIQPLGIVSGLTTWNQLV